MNACFPGPQSWRSRRLRCCSSSLQAWVLRALEPQARGIAGVEVSASSPYYHRELHRRRGLKSVDMLARGILQNLLLFSAALALLTLRMLTVTPTTSYIPDNRREARTSLQMRLLAGEPATRETSAEASEYTATQQKPRNNEIKTPW